MTPTIDSSRHDPGRVLDRKSTCQKRNKCRTVCASSAVIIPIEEDRLGIVDPDIEMGRIVQDGLDRHEVAVEASPPDLDGLVWYAWIPELGPGDRVVRGIEVETYCRHQS